MSMFKGEIADLNEVAYEDVKCRNCAYLKEQFCEWAEVNISDLDTGYCCMFLNPKLVKEVEKCQK